MHNSKKNSQVFQVNLGFFSEHFGRLAIHCTPRYDGRGNKLGYMTNDRIWFDREAIECATRMQDVATKVGMKLLRAADIVS